MKRLKYCALVFKGKKCGYKGESITCNKTPEYCRMLCNYKRFVRMR